MAAILEFRVWRVSCFVRRHTVGNLFILSLGSPSLRPSFISTHWHIVRAAMNINIQEWPYKEASTHYRSLCLRISWSLRENRNSCWFPCFHPVNNICLHKKWVYSCLSFLMSRLFTMKYFCLQSVSNIFLDWQVVAVAGAAVSGDFTGQAQVWSFWWWDGSVWGMVWPDLGTSDHRTNPNLGQQQDAGHRPHKPSFSPGQTPVKYFSPKQHANCRPL